MARAAPPSAGARAAYAAWLEEVDADVAVVEIPLLYETGADAAFDAVVVVTAPEDVRRARSGVDGGRAVGAARSRTRKRRPARTSRT